MKIVNANRNHTSVDLTSVKIEEKDRGIQTIPQLKLILCFIHFSLVLPLYFALRIQAQV